MDDNSKKKKRKPNFVFNISVQNVEFINQLVYTKIVQGNLKYSFSEAIKEGISLLQDENQEIPKRLNLERRYYKGGKQRVNEKIYKTSIASTEILNDWIEDYIVYTIERNDIYFGKINVIEEVINLLKNKYKSQLLQIPN